MIDRVRAMKQEHDFGMRFRHKAPVHLHRSVGAEAPCIHCIDPLTFLALERRNWGIRVVYLW